MKNDRLKPYIHKIKGTKYYAFFDILNGNFYCLEPSGTVEDVRKQLLEAGLIFSSTAPVPFKTRLNVIKKDGEIFLRNLQVSLDGLSGETCWSLTKNSNPGKSITKDIISAILTNLIDIPLSTLTVVANVGKKEILAELIKGISFSILQLQFEKEMKSEDIKEYFADSARNIRIITHRTAPMEKINTDPEAFFYNQTFNPCLGHQVAINYDGMIKPCLWWPYNLGDIRNDRLKDMIIAGKFDKYWNASKDTIPICKDCEYRYNCMDCRIDPACRKEDFKNKPTFCQYDPLTGTGNK